MNRIVQIGARKIDLGKAYPLTLGDARALKALGVDILNLTSLGIEEIITFVGYIGRKADPDLTDADVIATPISVLADLASDAVGKDEEAKESDFLASSTSSVANTGGRKSPSKH